MGLLGLISDIHGDPIALELAWAHLVALGVETILCAGDLVGYGPYPDRVASFLQDRQIPAIRGNHDRWALERGAGVPDEFRGGTPSSATLEFLDALPADIYGERGGRTVAMVHGTIRSDCEFVNRREYPADRLDGLLADLRTDLLIFGHTHEPMWHKGPNGLVVNPGSTVSMPVVSTSRTFAIVDLDELSASFHDVETGEPVEVAPWESPSILEDQPRRVRP